jgi:DNA polymerase-3 subunit gamma/tau
VEVDAATNSGKADIKKLLEEISYTSFSGKRRLYLFDEAHQLSKEALDALLKPLEDDLPGSEDKRLVCIFCTTEPEKMRQTILSRCAPIFRVAPLSPEVVADHLAAICDKEGITYERDMLPLVAEITECHIRDALKAIEGVSMLGSVDRASVTSYLHLDLNASYLEVLEALGSDLGKVIATIEETLQRTSPATCYERLAEVSMLAYMVSLGAGKPPAYWDRDRLLAVGQAKGAALLGYATRLSSRPGRPTSSMLLCDLAHLHHGLVDPSNQVVVETRTAPVPSGVRALPPEKTTPHPAPKPDPVGTLEQSRASGATCVAPLIAVKRDLDERTPTSSGLDRDTFCWLLGLRIAELDGADRGPPGRRNLDRG